MISVVIVYPTRIVVDWAKATVVTEMLAAMTRCDHARKGFLMKCLQILGFVMQWQPEAGADGLSSRKDVVISCLSMG